MLPVSGSNFLAAQGHRKKSSSFRKIPRYFTAGENCFNASPRKAMKLFLATGTFAHQCHGEAPISSES
jgi:hypothetical protein